MSAWMSAGRFSAPVSGCSGSLCVSYGIPPCLIHSDKLWYKNCWLFFSVGDSVSSSWMSSKLFTNQTLWLPWKQEWFYWITSKPPGGSLTSSPGTKWEEPCRVQSSFQKTVCYCFRTSCHRVLVQSPYYLSSNQTFLIYEIYQDSPTKPRHYLGYCCPTEFSWLSY